MTTLQGLLQYFDAVNNNIEQVQGSPTVWHSNRIQLHWAIISSSLAVYMH